MSKNPFDPEAVDDLPEQLSVFPLPGATLLHGTQLPLNIFEPRYLNMVLDALGGERLIGMVQPLPDQTDADAPALYDVGCAGRIVSFAEAGDGRLLITLRGVCRFRLGDELPARCGYRRVVANWAEFAADLQPGPPVERSIEDLKTILQHYLRVRDVRVDWQALARMSAARVLDMLAMSLPFAPDEKQALLEARDGASRWQVLAAIARMVTSASQPQPGATRH